MSVGAPLSKQEIVDRFNSMVANQLTVPRGSANWHSGNQPLNLVGNRGRPNPTITGNPFGARAEPLKAVSDLPSGNLVASVMFNVLHRFAMEFTRVRRAQVWQRTGTGANTATFLGENYAALRTDLALSLDIPNHPDPGAPVNSAQVDQFLTALRNRINAKRSTDANFMMAIMSCHNSCHSSCHGSRGRR